MRGVVKRAVILLIRFYQLTLSPLLGPTCRFYPSCSHYAAQAVETYGVVRGGRLALKRLLRCGPWTEGGYDPLPAPPHKPWKEVT